MKYDPLPGADEPLRKAITALYQADESVCVQRLLAALGKNEVPQAAIQKTATELVETIRSDKTAHGGLDAFLQEFKLSSREGIALMCLAEALLRVPDGRTADALIKDKLGAANWRSHLGKSESLLVNASTWGLLLTGKFIAMDHTEKQDLTASLTRLASRSGEPLIRKAVSKAMGIMGHQFVLAETMAAGLKKAHKLQARGFLYSYDMLGEAARTAEAADHYFQAYRNSIALIGGSATAKACEQNPGISVKLSALHARYEFAKMSRMLDEMIPRLLILAQAAKAAGIGMTIDAEEADRLEPSLVLLQRLAQNPKLQNWDGLGFVVQAYQKRAPAVLDWLADIALKSNKKLMIRLVKGAYWDSEIKAAQVLGYRDYPVYTRKLNTDVCYLVCARKLLAQPKAFYAMFATHNAHTVASILHYAKGRSDFEFQCLHGMGEALYHQVVQQCGQRCRIYAPIGAHKDLLAYLVRRLLENGANNSFVNRLVDKTLPIAEVVADPAAELRSLAPTDYRHPSIPLPLDLYGVQRKNSAGLNLADNQVLSGLARASASFVNKQWQAAPLVVGDDLPVAAYQIVENPARLSEPAGMVSPATPEHIAVALAAAAACQDHWDGMGGKTRSEILCKAADLYQANKNELLELCIREAGKTLADAVAELREAIDFLRYYALRGSLDFAGAMELSGPTGEKNTLSLHGKGIIVCISPWNFPLAIFTGQISAALMAGNSVLAKPAQQTPLIASFAVQLLHQAGVPKAVLQLLPGDGSVGGQLTADPQVAGVAFTGSTATAGIIQQSLSRREAPIATLIAETGGINAMLVDSTALPEQVVQDVIASAFQSAGQRCSALRMLYLQEDIADGMITMLKGAMAELTTGDPDMLSSDLGPVIDQQARQNIIDHIELQRAAGRKIHTAPLSAVASTGYFVAPVVIEIDSIADLKREIFGPVLHIARYKACQLDQVVDTINQTGYGLTLGIHSRIESTVHRIVARARVGNIYVNRNMIGAVVGVQPFGGEGYSGTGPKAGGPNYLYRFAVERCVSTDTTASGGNASLLSLAE